MWPYVAVALTAHRRRQNVVRTKKFATSRRRVACMILPPFDDLCALSQYTRKAKWNSFVSCVVLISVILHENRNVFRLFVVMVCAQNFAPSTSFVRLYLNHELT